MLTLCFVLLVDAMTGGGMPKLPGAVKEAGLDAWRRRKSSVLMFPDAAAKESAASAAAPGLVMRGDAEQGGARVFRSQPKPREARETRKGVSKSRHGTALADSSVTGMCFIIVVL
jgi:hypothetical protein